MTASLYKIALVTLVLCASYPAQAQPIESEPLPPPPGMQSGSGVTPAPLDSPSSGTIPLTTRAGAPVAQPAPSATSTSSGDDGMSGASGGSSAYELGAPTTAPAPDPMSAERAGSAPPASNMPEDTGAGAPPLAPSIPYGGSIGTAPPEKQVSPDKKFCTLKVDFGSRGAGIDQKTASKVKEYLDANADKLTYLKAPWGREGEYAYCLDIAQHNNRARIYKDLKRLMPPPARNDSARGDTTLSGAGFETITTAK